MSATRVAEPDPSPDPITRFSGDHRFLSNFSASVIKVSLSLGDQTTDDPFEGSVEPFTATTVEHAYQSLKTTDRRWQLEILLTHTAASARQSGRRIPKALVRPDWDQIRVNLMRALVKMKFEQHEDLALRLHLTGDRDLIEGNRWGDRFWGMTPTTTPASGTPNRIVAGVNYTGENWLGKILMERRSALRALRPQFDRRQFARGSER